MNIQVIKEVFHGSHEGTISFPELVGKLVAQGVESYHVDLVCSEWRYYTPSGESHVERGPAALPPAAEEFSAPQVLAAIKSSQAKEINYQQFQQRVLAAGCVFYIAYLSGRQVVYFGRKGEMHIEKFPNSK